MKKTIRFTALCMVLLLLCACATNVQAPALNDSVRAQYDTATVLRGDVQQLSVYGAGISKEFLAADATASGVVQQVHVRLGDTVSEGDLVAQVDTNRLQARLDSLKAQLEQLTTRYEQQIASAEAQLQILSLQKTQSGADTVLLSLEEEKLQAKLTYLQGSLSEQAGQLERSIAEAEQAVELSYIYAPCDGVVAAVDAMAGRYVANGTTLIRIAREGSEYLLCTEGNSLLARTKGVCSMQLGDTVYPVELMEYSEEEFMAAMLSGNVPARFRLPEGLSVQVGDSAQLRVVEREAKDALYLPKGAVFEGSGLNKGYVYRIVDGEKIYTEVTYAFQTESWTVISSGLEEGEVVYVPQSS